MVLSRLKDENGGKVHQGSELHHFKNTTTKICANQTLADLKSLDDQMRACLEWSDVNLQSSSFWMLRAGKILKNCDCLNEKSALVSIADVFRAPLKDKGADLTSILDEIEGIDDYARGLGAIATTRSSPDSAKWPNIMLVSELLLCLSLLYR